MTTHVRSFAFHGLTVRDKLIMKSMIERCAVRSGRHWVPDQMESADCIFLQGKPPAGMRANAELIRVRAPDSGGTEAMQCPTQVSEFMKFLSGIDQRLGCNHWHPLIEKIQLQLKGTEEFALLNVNGSGWMLHPTERQCSALGLLEHAPKELVEAESGQWELGHAVSSNRHPRRALEVLLWFLGLASGGEGVLPGIGVDRPLQMRTWPYLLARAPRQFSQLATLLREKPQSASELQLASNATMADVAAFVNACSLCGFLVPVAETAKLRAPVGHLGQPSARPAQGFSRFLGAIRVALGMSSMQRAT